MDTQTTEHMYTNRGEKRILNTLFSSCKSIPSEWSLFQELKVFWKLGWLKLGFFHGFLCHLGQYIQVCSRGWKQANRSYSVLWACGHEPAPIWDPYAQMSPCWQISSASGVSRYYLVCHSSYWSHCSSSKLDRHRCIPVSWPLQLTLPYLSRCLPLVRLRLRCWTVKQSSWCASTSAETDVGAVISGRSIKQTAGGSKVWRGHN